MTIALRHFGFNLNNPDGPNTFVKQHGPYADVLVNALPGLKELVRRCIKLYGEKPRTRDNQPITANKMHPEWHWRYPKGAGAAPDLLDGTGETDWLLPGHAPAEEYKRISEMIYRETGCEVTVYTGGPREQTLASRSTEGYVRKAVLDAQSPMNMLLPKIRFRDKAGIIDTATQPMSDYAMVMMIRQGSPEGVEPEATGTLWANRPMPPVIMSSKAFRDPGRMAWVKTNRAKIPAFYVYLDDEPNRPNTQDSIAWHNDPGIRATLVGDLDWFSEPFIRELK